MTTVTIYYNLVESVREADRMPVESSFSETEVSLNNKERNV